MTRQLNVSTSAQDGAVVQRPYPFQPHAQATARVEHAFVLGCRRSNRRARSETSGAGDSVQE